MPQNLKPIVMFAMNQWSSSSGGIQTVNRELAAAVARKYGSLQCLCLVTNVNAEEKADARRRGVELIAGSESDNWGSAEIEAALNHFDHAQVQAVIGHGKFSGYFVRDLRRNRFHSAKHVHFVHSSPLDTEHLKEYRTNTYVQERERRLAEEIALSADADLVACIGPRLTRFMKDQLTPRKCRARVIRLDCGITIDESKEYLPPEQPTVLCVGRTDSMGVKGLDIFALAAGHLNQMWLQNPMTRERPRPRFVVRGAKERPEELAESLHRTAAAVFADTHFVVRPYTTCANELETDFLQASVFVMPSREEGFGLVACEALSLGVPVVVSKESGIAEVIHAAARQKFFDIGPTIVDIAGGLETAASRFAQAIISVLENEGRAAERTHSLRQLLYLSCSWDAAADSLIEAIYPARSRRVQHLATSMEAPEVLRRHRDQLLSHPGVVSVGISNAIIIDVLPDTKPDFPSNLEGIDVVVRTTQPVTFTAASVRPVIPPGSILLVQGQEIACVAGLVVGSGERVMALTTAHAIVPHSHRDDIFVVTKAGDRVKAYFYSADEDADLALLTLENEPAWKDEMEIGEPELLMHVRILLPGNETVYGSVAQVNVSTRHPAGSSDEASNALQDLFTVSTKASLRPGASGALVVEDDSGAAVGVVIAQSSARSDETIVYIRPVKTFLTNRSLRMCLAVTSNAASAPKPLKVAMVVTNSDVFHKLTARLTKVKETWQGTRQYYVGSIPGQRSIRVWVHLVHGIGNLNSAVGTTLLLQELHPDLLVLVGLAGGAKPSKETVGDVIVASSVVYYEPARVDSRGSSPRYSFLHKTPPFLEEAARRIATHADMRSPGEKTSMPIPRIHVGVIASGEKLFSGPSEITDTLAKSFEVLGVEMEAAGVAQAVSQVSTPFISVHGIADLIVERGKTDSGRELAAGAASDVAMKLIENVLSTPGVRRLLARD